MLILKKTPIYTNNDDDYYETSVEIQSKADKSYNTLRNYSIPIDSSVVVQ